MPRPDRNVDRGGFYDQGAAPTTEAPRVPAMTRSEESIKDRAKPDGIAIAKLR
ncbi:hypothetical protein LJR009_005924 [Bosea sp. LjRoot9]|uniref:hypothetical protein n=1 Tax=Bosea sp. LjRoot9 TaxID=3342341 RepID=UPI003ECFE6C4